LQLANCNISESDPKPTIRHAGYLLKRSNFPYTSTPYKNAVSNGAETVFSTTVSSASSSNERLSPYNQLPFGGLDDDTLEGGKGNEYITQATDTTAVISNITLRRTEELSAEVKSSTFTETSSSVVESEQNESHEIDEPCFCSPIVQYFKGIFNQPKNKNALTVKTDVSPQRRTSPTKRSSPNNKSISSPPKSPKPYNMPLKPPAKSDPMPISPAGGGERKVISAGTSKQQQQQRRRSSYTNANDNSDNNIGIAPTLSTLASSSSKDEQKKKIYPPPPPDYIDPKDGHIWRSKYCILEEGILYFYRTAEEGESDEAFTERYESRAYSEELQDIVLGEELVFHSSISPGRRSISKEDRILNRAAHDRNMMGSTDFLSKSPMPMKKSDMFFASPFHRQGSSVITGTSSFNSQNAVDRGRRSPSSNNMLRSQSTSTFNHDADILWEKRVALDCVGAVRSSGQEYGENAFELLAYGSDERDDMDGLRYEEDTTTTGIGASRKNEIIDRLVLRASSVDDRNGWMFQFHRSLTSFVMQQFVNSVRTGSDAGGGGSRSRPLSPHSPAHQHLRVASGGSVSPFITGSGKQQSFATSPSGNASFGGGSAFSSHIVGSLSHGHGRNALYRRQVRDGRASSIGSAASPMHTPTGTPAGGSSPASERGGIGKDKPLMPSSLMIQSDSSKLQNKVELPSLRGLRDGKENDKVPSPQAPPSILRSPPKKYIPPHLRRKMEAEKAALESSEVMETRSPVDELVPLKDQSSPKLMTLTSSESLDESFSVSATSDSSMLSRQMESADEFISINYRLGGCADPTVIIGSISDHTYIDRKASVVGNARLEAYGGRGGGFFTSYGRHRQIQSIEEDESSTLLDDLDEHASANKHSTTRSVLKWEVGASSECGVRNSNEDSYVVINNLDELLETEGLSSFSKQDLGKTSQQGLYAIFDGHVGNQAARYSAENFHKILMEQQSVLASEDSAASYSCSIEDRAETVLREAFDRLDRDFCRLCTKDGRDWDCGATALVAFIVDDVVSLANLGDCRGVVCRLVSNTINDSDSLEIDGWEELDRDENEDENVVWDRASGGGSTSEGKLLWKEITEDHSPLVEEERARIERANGWIIQECEIPIGQLHRMDIFDNDVVEIVKRCFADRMKTHRSDPVRQIQIARTCGDLAVSRAIGDRDFKEAYNLPPNKEQLSRSWEGPLVFIYPDGHSGKFRGDIVSNVPDVETFKVGQEGVLNEFLLMACDGLWDVMDSDDAVRIAKELLFDKKLSAQDAAHRLAELAQHLGSSDNITVIVIRFYWAEAEDD